MKVYKVYDYGGEESKGGHGTVFPVQDVEREMNSLASDGWTIFHIQATAALMRFFCEKDADAVELLKGGRTYEKKKVDGK